VLQAGRRLRPAHEQIERELGASEKRLAVPIKQAIDLSELPDLLKKYVIIAAFNGAGGVRHFSPLSGVSRGKLILPYSDRGFLRLEDFERAWSAPGRARQCILIRWLGEPAVGSPPF